MLVSIIIPVYNVEQYITACLETVLQQTYRQLEVILVDDCTQDASVKIAKEYIESSPLKEGLSFVYLKHEKNRGLSASRNTGIECAKGDYLYFLDSDDTISPDCIEKLVKKTNDGEVDVVCGAFECIGEEGYMWEDWEHKDTIYRGGEKILEAFIDRQIYPMAWNKLIKNIVLKEKKLYFKEGIIHEDLLWSYMVALAVDTVAMVSNITYFYLIRPGSIMTTPKKKKSLESKIAILKEMNNYPYDKIFEKQIDKYFLELKYTWMSHILESKEVSGIEKMKYVVVAGGLKGGFGFLIRFAGNYLNCRLKNKRFCF